MIILCTSIGLVLFLLGAGRINIRKNYLAIREVCIFLDRQVVGKVLNLEEEGGQPEKRIAIHRQ
jgi:hypothetical protein